MGKKRTKDNTRKRLKQDHSKKSSQAVSKKKLNVIPIAKVLFDSADKLPKNDEHGNAILEGFTLHPPKEVLPDNLNKRPAYITEIEFSDLILDKQVYIGLKSKKGPFEETKNPVYLIEAFLCAHENGIYPPMWVLNFMAGVFKKYHRALGYEKYPKGRGKLTLDDLFGFGINKGQTPRFKRVLQLDRNEMLMVDVKKLTLLNYSIDVASGMVARKLEETQGWDKTGLKLGELSASTIEDIYKKKWSKFFNDKAFEKIVLNSLDKDSFLKSFPEDCTSYTTKNKKL